jgi:hypothetical protein
MSKTLLHHTLIKNIFDICVDFLTFIHFHYLKIHRLLSCLQRRNIFRQDLGIGIQIFKRSNKANLFIALVQYHISSENIILFRCSCIVQCSLFRNHRTRFFLFSTKPSVFSHQFSCESHKLLNCLEIDFLQIGIETDWLNSFIKSRKFSFTVLFYKPY